MIGVAAAAVPRAVARASAGSLDFVRPRAAIPADDCPLEAWRHGLTGAGRDAVLFRQLAQEQPGRRGRRPGQPPAQVELLPAGKGLSQLRAQYERPLLALTGLVTLVLLITCTNVGNLLMVRNSCAAA